jgi:hypothetical protein
MTHYKLYYFDIKGRGEIIRWLLKYLDLAYEDFRFDEKEWVNVKPKMPFNQVINLNELFFLKIFYKRSL